MRIGLSRLTVLQDRDRSMAQKVVELVNQTNRQLIERLLEVARQADGSLVAAHQEEWGEQVPVRKMRQKIAMMKTVGRQKVVMHQPNDIPRPAKRTEALTPLGGGDQLTPKIDPRYRFGLTRQIGE